MNTIFIGISTFQKFVEMAKQQPSNAPVVYGDGSRTTTQDKHGTQHEYSYTVFYMAGDTVYYYSQALVTLRYYNGMCLDYSEDAIRKILAALRDVPAVFTVILEENGLEVVSAQVARPRDYTFPTGEPVVYMSESRGTFVRK